MERAAIAVDVDHALAELLACAAAWHATEYGDEVAVSEIASASWASVWAAAGSTKAESDDKTRAFFQSRHFETQMQAARGAREALKPLRKYFTLVALTDRPRIVEKQTREWLDRCFLGVFDKLVFVDADDPDSFITRKRELYQELKVQIAVGADAEILAQTATNVPHAVLVDSMPWTTGPETYNQLERLVDWTSARSAFERIVQELQLTPARKVYAGPRLARYTDDVVTVSARKPAVFYANIINSKFTVQKQKSVRLQACEMAITTAVQAAEMLRLQSNAITTKISTRYTMNRPKERGGYRVPKLEMVLQRVDRGA